MLFNTLSFFVFFGVVVAGPMVRAREFFQRLLFVARAGSK